MLKENKDYKTLLLRKEVVQFIYDLRCYEQLQLSTSSPKVYFSIEKQEEYLREFNPWAEKLRKFIKAHNEGYKILDVQPGDNFVLEHTLQSIADNEEEQKEISRTVKEIIYLIRCCPNIETICTELMRFNQRHLYNPLIPSSDLEMIINEMLKAIPIDKSSSEYKFLMNECTHEIWFMSYFFRRDSVENHQDNLNTFLQSRLSSKELPISSNMIRTILPGYLKLSIPIDENVLKDLLDKTTYVYKDIVIFILKEVYHSKNLLPFTIEEYLDYLFEELQKPNQIDSNLNVKPSQMEIASGIINRLEYLNCLFGREEVLPALTKKIIDTNQEYLKQFIENYFRVTRDSISEDSFKKAYQEASSKIDDIKRDLVFVLRQIDEKKKKAEN